MSVQVYSKSSCVQCTATHRALDKEGIEYSVIDLEGDPHAVNALRALGYSQAPVVIAGDQHWGGFRPDRIKALVAA
ncbi:MULTISPECIES: glutaredoxin-like protein NrdH [Rhodococcus]|uniref:Glutaredoxin-like protein NrdH n=1 Tax=Rhodococcus opacus (strain B4) TaxID=632772 RepID=C1BEA8_RHOOB|nr:MULTISPECIES: glutaredoxin-like protein NrdH [Rhodococcus]MBC2637497.1 glutaredoxin-like protein NrdH [Rhodococcus sp. 3A]MBC2898411.1 glutaredoxin-like protein NrdH [Rhodococcus sp. 4CII]BAH56148.1 glutaredoxin-like protein [Rhodococcus opacus B4]